MVGEDEERTARRLGEVLRAALPGEVRVEGRGVHWRVAVEHGARGAGVACFWYAPAGPGTMMLGLGGSNAHLGAVVPGAPRVARAGAEYFVELREGERRIADGRAHDPSVVAGCLHAWLVERRDLGELYAQWPFVDAKLRALRRLAALVESAPAGPSPVRVVIEHDIGDELWVYGDDRSCRLDPGPEATAGCAFLIGQSQVAAAMVGESALGEVVAAWSQGQVTLAALARRVPGLEVLPFAELLERGEAARWHWANALAAAEHGVYPLCEFRPLIERVVARREICRFFSFTSLSTLCFSYSSNYPFVRDDLPVVAALGDGRFAVDHARDGGTGDARQTAERLAKILAAAPHRPFRGSAAHHDRSFVDEELARQGSSLRARLVQKRQWYGVRVVAGRREVGISCHREWSLTLYEDGVKVGSEEHRDGPAAVAALRRWLELPDER